MGIRLTIRPQTRSTHLKTMQATLELEKTVKKTPRPFQRRMIELAIDRLETLGTACWIAPTGTGKTFTTATALAEEFRNRYDRIFILIHQDPLPVQWMNTVHSVGFGAGVGTADIKGGWDLGAIVSDKTKASFSDHLKRKFHHHNNKVVVTMLPTLVGRLSDLSDNHLKGSTLLIYDEAHKTRFHECARLLENKLRQVENSTLHILGVTATPARHPDKKEQFHDAYYFPKNTWISTLTQQEAIALGYWKSIRYIDNTPEYIHEAADLFSGLSVSMDGEIADTKQSVVMRELIPSHFRDWLAAQDEQSIKETTLWACTDRKHADALSQYIQSQGFTAMVIDGRTESKPKAIGQVDSGTIQHACVIGCLQEGADIPRICQVVLCRIFGSTATICQIVGRGARPWDDRDLKVFDFGQNWADHPLPCQIDWFVHVNSKKMFRDVAMTICQDPSCRKRHDSIPKPLHPSGDRKITPILSAAEYSNGDEINLDDPLVCHSCGTAVTYDSKKIEKYAKWIMNLRAAIAAETAPPRPNFRRSGVTVGSEWSGILTPRKMYELSLWEKDEEEEGDGILTPNNKKREWLSKAELVEKRQNAYLTKERAIKYLSEAFKKSSGIDMSRCREVANVDIDRGLKSALFVQYLNGRAPSGAWVVFGGDDDTLARFGPNSDRPMLDSKNFPLKMPSAIKGKLYDRAAEVAFTELNNCKGAQTELSQWLMLELEKLSESERQPKHPKYRFLKNWIDRILAVEHVEDEGSDF